MAETVLSVISEVSKRVGLGAQTSAFSSTDDGVQQMVALLNEVGQEVVERVRWQWVVRRVTITTVAAETQGNIETLTGVELDSIANGTFWYDTLRRPMYGPLDDKDYQLVKAFIPAGPEYSYRIQGTQLLINPVPPAGDTISCVIRTKYWLLAVDGATYRKAIGADTDTLLMDPDLAKLGLKARWKAEKGLPYAEDQRAYEMALASRANKTGTKPALNMADGPMDSYLPGIWVPAGTWPL